MEQFTFYGLYADILQGMDDVSAGKFAKRICEYEFGDKEPENGMTEKESFYWNEVFGMLKAVKEKESEGKPPKKYNLRSPHLTFYDTYYKAMKLLNDSQAGLFVKAICNYMLHGKAVSFKDREMQGYFNLCKRKMDLSRQRKSFGTVGGNVKKKTGTEKVDEKESPKKQPRIEKIEVIESIEEQPRTETVEIKESSKEQLRTEAVEVEESTGKPPRTETVTEKESAEDNMLVHAEEPNITRTYDKFRNKYPDIKGVLYGNSKKYETALDWLDVASKIGLDTELAKERNIYYLAQKYVQKYGEKG